jgi:ATP-dependent DNA ligase
LAANGLDAWAQVVGNGYEGLVAKDEISVYEAGPTRRWLKVKQPDWTVSRATAGGVASPLADLAYGRWLR